MQTVKLFCLPYAGGSAAVFAQWQQYLDPRIRLVPVELAGRGRRIKDPLYGSLSDAMNDAFRIITNSIDGSSYAIMGHSMGSLIAYEVAQKIRTANIPQPSHVFFSGHGAPHIPLKEDKKFNLMTDAEFKKEMIALGGTPPEFFQYPELMELFLPLLRSDFAIAETEIHTREIRPLDCNITIFHGKKDDLTAGQSDDWKCHTLKNCRIHYFEGGHFFINEEIAEITRLINETLLFADILHSF